HLHYGERLRRADGLQRDADDVPDPGCGAVARDGGEPMGSLPSLPALVAAPRLAGGCEGVVRGQPGGAVGGLARAHGGLVWLPHGPLHGDALPGSAPEPVLDPRRAPDLSRGPTPPGDDFARARAVPQPADVAGLRGAGSAGEPDRPQLLR